MCLESTFRPRTDRRDPGGPGARITYDVLVRIYDTIIPTYVHMLRNCEHLLDRLEAHAAEQGIEPAELLEARLIPDQWAFTRQIQAVCDAAKWGAAKLAGKEGPSNPDTETTVEELRGRIQSIISYLESFTPEDYEAAEDRHCQHKWMEDRWVRGADYVRYYSLPTFYFHYTLAYEILRYKGVSLDKFDFLKGLPLRD